MKIGAYYSHLNGYEWMQYHHQGVWNEIEDVIRSIDASKYKTKVSKEKTMLGTLLYSPEELNRSMDVAFQTLKWKESKTYYWVTDDYLLTQRIMNLPQDKQKAEIVAAGKTPIQSYNQTDFVKDRIAVEVQFGKYSFIAYDLFVKHMAFFVGNQIDLGIEIIPMKCMQREMSSGPGYYEGALYDLARQGRGIPSVPLILIGVEP
jgi:hypothetical protein